MSRVVRVGFVAVFIIAALFENGLFAQNQTDNVSPVVIDGSLPYHIDLVRYAVGLADMPTLHSFAKAQWDGKWLLIGGRTNGLHAFTQNGFVNFPPAFQNRDVWVVDPVNGESWSRSLADISSGLSLAEVDSLAVTNNQFYQDGDRLYLTGGYGLQTDFDYVTFDALTSINVPGLMNWVQGSDGTAADEIKQIHDPLFAVTGGAMLPIDGRTHLVFGQDFQGDYTPFGNGVYTNQVRSFTIVETDDSLTVQDVSQSFPNENYRRRDLNVVPIVRAAEDGSLHEEIRAYSGVFTPAGGAWTVPVEINTQGEPSMLDPGDDAAFKQAMNGYHSAKLGLYSEASDEMHSLLFGGISLNYYDATTQTLVQDDMLPFIDQSTSIVIDNLGNYTQYLLPTEFPEILDEQSGNKLLFGTNAEFMIADGIPTYPNGVIRMDEMTEPTTLGYILGGISADQPHRGNTAASGWIFEVQYSPTISVPEPNSPPLLTFSVLGLGTLLVLRRSRSCSDQITHRVTSRSS